MSQSLILIGSAEDYTEREIQVKALETKSFESLFAFCGNASPWPRPQAQIVSEDAIGRSVSRRIQFFADPEYIPILLAPLIVRSLWNTTEARGLVIGYPGISLERLSAASEMLTKGCEAVLLRREQQTPLVVAISRSVLTERLIHHWAMCVEQFSSDSRPASRHDPGLGASVVEHVCDLVASVRDTRNAQPISHLSVSTGADLPAAIRDAVRTLLPESQLLAEDPLANAAGVLNSASAKVTQDSGNLITSLMFLTWSSRSDLQAAYKLSDPEGRTGLVDWFLSRAAIELGVGEEFLAPVREVRQNPPKTPTPAESPLLTRSVNDPALLPTASVNLIGYPRADMGMGELLRQSAAALSTTKIPFCAVDFTHGITASQQNTRLESLISTSNPYEVNLFHINADQMPLVREKLGPDFFRGHYNIAFWAWELSKFPVEWKNSIDLVDEIWALSRFVRDAIAAQTSKPVLWMPPAVEFPEPSDSDIESVRRRLRLPRDKFLFLFAFDFSSFASRKNFEACIQAFRSAFPGGDKNVGLVLKTIWHHHQQREYWHLLRTVGADTNIFLVDQVLPQTEMRSLVAACDAFVSLHRSEGFGLGIAEAMYLGKPVIVTNYSGNTDFTNGNNSCLVDYHLIPLKPADYLFGEGSSWAEPNVQRAAEYMRRLVADRVYATKLGRAASAFIREYHNCRAIGERQSARLHRVRAARAHLIERRETEDVERTVVHGNAKVWQWAAKKLRRNALE